VPRKGKDWGNCPRCGRKISWVETYTKGDRTYYVAVHYQGRDEKGKKIVEKCHLGPEEYLYVTVTHPQLVLQGAVQDVKEPNARLLAYLDALIEAIPHAKLDSEKALMLAQRFKEIGAKLEEYARERREREEVERATVESGDDRGAAQPA